MPKKAAERKRAESVLDIIVRLPPRLNIKYEPIFKFLVFFKKDISSWYVFIVFKAGVFARCVGFNVLLRMIRPSNTTLPFVWAECVGD